MPMGLGTTLPAAWDLVFEESLRGDFMGKYLTGSEKKLTSLREEFTEATQKRRLCGPGGRTSPSGLLGF